MVLNKIIQNRREAIFQTEEYQKLIKNHYQSNKKLFQKKNKEYYQKNKEKIKNRMSKNYYENRKTKRCVCE